MTTSTTKKKRSSSAKPANSARITPLGIIAAFISLTEAALAYPVTHTTGQIQLLLTCFAIGFPVFISAGFFWLCYRKPEALLAHPQFKTAEEATAYMNALRGYVQKAEADATLIYASSEEMKNLTAQAKVATEEIKALEGKLQDSVKNLEQEIKESEKRSFAKAFFLAG